MAKRANTTAGKGRAAGKRGSVEAKATKRATDGTQESDKIVRDTFKMPQREYALIDELKQRCLALGVDVKKSEVLRAGLVAIRELSDERLAEVMRPLTAARAERAARKPSRSATAA